MSADPRSVWQVCLVALLCGIPALLCLQFVRFSTPMPAYWDDARAFAARGVIAQHFTPAAYPLLLGCAIKLHPSNAVFAAKMTQALLHIVMACLVWVVARALRGSQCAALCAALLIGLRPELLTSVGKVWDVTLSTALLLLFAALLLRLLHNEVPHPAKPLMMGLVWGLGIFDRPNYALLVVPVLYVVFHARFRALSMPRPQRLAACASIALGAAGTYLCLSMVAWHALYAPANGPYNFFAGHNVFSEAALRAHLNAEFSIVPALQSLGVPFTDAHDLSLRSIYSHAALRFAVTHPHEELRLFGWKLFTFLRPDTRLHALVSTTGVLLLCSALAVPFWCFATVSAYRRKSIWTSVDSITVWIAFAYLLPFLLTNSDPRFRTPLDALLLAHAVALVSRMKSQRA